MQPLLQHASALALELAALGVAAVLGALAPGFLRLKHRGMQLALSGVSGVMIGLAAFHLMPHAVEAIGRGAPDDHGSSLEAAMLAAVAGFCGMFLLERFFCFHHHEEPSEESAPHDHACCHGHGAAAESKEAGSHAMAAGGAFLGLSIHGLLEGIALGAAVAAEPAEVRLAGLGVFLAILLHKPFDSLTIAALMARAGAGTGRIVWTALLLFLAVPAGVLLFGVGMSSISDADGLVLGFAAGMFLCIAASDLLPELQFHSHDRVAMSAALLIGVVLAWGIARLEHATHDHGGEGGAAHSSHAH